MGAMGVEGHGGRVERGRAERAGMHWGPLKSLIGSRGICRHWGRWRVHGGPWRSRAGGRVERGKGGASGAGGAGGHALGPFKVI